MKGLVSTIDIRPQPNYDEKAVDVILAINMVLKACDNAYDVAYLVSGDSDFAPAVEMVRRIGKKVVYVYFWDKNKQKQEQRFSHRLAKVATGKAGFEKRWASSLSE